MPINSLRLCSVLAEIESMFSTSFSLILLENELGDRPKAIECAKRATEVIPEKSEGYMELYRLWTNNYELTNCYQTFLNTEETEQGNDVADAIKKALRCSDCDSDFINEVVDFQKRCVQYALSDIEADNQKANTYISEETSKSKENKQRELNGVEHRLLLFYFMGNLEIGCMNDVG